MTTLASGVMITAPGGAVLFLKRGDGGDHPGEWCFPGGKVEDGETLADAAMRETFEESGYQIETLGHPLTRRVKDGADFTTYAHVADAEFVPTLSDESTAYAWAPPDDPPEPLHPGCMVALQRAGMDELGVAKAIAAGELASPTRYMNVSLFDMRITGTGVSYRSKGDEFVYRRPENYLTEEFLARCNGLPVIWKHPNKATLDSKEFSARVVGTMLLPYLKGPEVWGVAKVFDDDAIKMMEAEQLSTSPAVVLGSEGNSILETDAGDKILIEGKPKLLDHLAICAAGVWDKQQEPNGIRADSHEGNHMTDKSLDKTAADAAEDEAKVADKAKADADAGEKLDKVLAHLDSVAKVCDSLGKRLDAFEDEKKADKAKKDADELASGKEPGEPKEVVADKAKKDADEAEAKKKAEEDDKAKADSAELRAKIADLESKIPKQISDADFVEMAETQAKADSVFSAFGKSAPRPLNGETPARYRRRLCADLKSHSPDWKAIDVAGLDDKSFEVVEGKVYADAMDAANHPVDLADGELREVSGINPVTGHRVVTFKGKNTFIKAMQPPARLIASVNTQPRH